MKHSLFCFLAVALSVVSCSTTKTVTQTANSIIAQKVEQPVWSHPNIFVKTDSLSIGTEPVSVKKVRSYFIPAIIYWGGESTMEYSINNQYFVHTFTDVIQQSFTEKQLDIMLEDRILEFSLNAIPNKFIHTSQFGFLFALVAYSYTYLDIAYQEEQCYEIAYRILKDGRCLKERSVSGKTISEPLRNTSQSTQNFILSYIAALTTDFKEQSMKVIEQIENDLMTL